MSESLYGAVGKRIRTARKAIGMSQELLALSIGVSRASVVNIEAGRQRLLLHVLVSIAAALGIEPCALLQNVATPDQSYANRALAAEARTRELEQQIAAARDRAASLFR